MDYSGRDREEELFKIIEGGEAHDGGAEDGSQFLNESGEGMELEPRHEAQTSTDCDDGSQNVGPLTIYGEVY
jgi:hypothetical protein